MEGTRMRTGASLAEALKGLLAEWSERTGITVEVWALPTADVPSRVAKGVLTVMAEGLDNVARHSQASTVSIAVTVAPSGLRLTISDDGKGFQPPPTGPGIARMRAAFAELGGSVSVTGVPEQGATVTGVVPGAGHIT
ncbi:sensor histidine kinase [Nonomuraea sp. NPDC048826]|uniref:sensor histidine kinase n=1 Tax=Nonomuraea sp. NPDC048826 TaxID=3364347 RepID=UPI003714CC02